MTARQDRRQRAVMASDAEWERIARAAASAGMEISRFIVHRALMPDAQPPEVTRRAVRELLVLSNLRSAAFARPAPKSSDACEAVERFLEQGGILDTLTDPGAATHKCGGEIEGG